MTKVIDVLKLIRQLRGCVKYIQHIKKGNNSGTIIAATGVGKTFMSLIILKKILKKWKNCNTIVVVPTIQLKDQWEKELKESNLKATVYVINTIVMSKKTYVCDFLILDESHRYSTGAEFSKVFNIINYKLLLCLTATLTDVIRPIIEKHAKIVDTITQKDAKDNNWISDYIEYNLPVELTDEDKAVYTSLNKQFNKYFSYFSFDFKLAMKCRGKVESANYADQMGWDPKLVAFYANRWGHFMKERKEWLYNTQGKIDITVEIIKRFSVKTVTFSESTKFADEVCKKLGESAVSYHSAVMTELKVNDKIIARCYKEEGKLIFRKISDNSPTSFLELKKTYPKIKRVGQKILLKEALVKFADNRYKINTICTARALDQGFNVEDIELGIIAARTTSEVSNTQRVGRIARKSQRKDGTWKRGVIVNVYVPKTQDERWLKAAQKNPDVIWINSIDEIKFE